MAAIIDLLRRSRLVQLWAPVFLWMAGIFYFSSRPNPLGFLPSSRHTANIDKFAHIGEYAGLTVLLHRALREQGGGGAREQGSKGDKERGRRGEGEKSLPHLVTPSPPHLCTSALIALAYALLDELHQELAPGRDFELADIGYDLVGIIAALGVIWLRGRGKASGGEGKQRIGTSRSCPQG